MYISDRGCVTSFPLSLNYSLNEDSRFFHSFACMFCLYANPSCKYIFYCAIDSGPVAVLSDQRFFLDFLQQTLFYSRLRNRFAMFIDIGINSRPLTHLYALFIRCKLSMLRIPFVKHCDNHEFCFTCVYFHSITFVNIN
jgi:hypothetical protein